MERGDIYRVSLNPAQGYEEKGDRYVLVVTTAQFNKVAQTSFVVPITNGGAHFSWNKLTVSLAGAETTVGGVILCSQLRAMDLVARKAVKIESVPEFVVEDVLAKLQAFLQ